MVWFGFGKEKAVTLLLAGVYFGMAGLYVAAGVIVLLSH
jgi:hypothetical protein